MARDTRGTSLGSPTLSRNSCVMTYSKSQSVAKDLIRLYMDRAQYDEYFETMDTFGIPRTKVDFDRPLSTKDPKTAVVRETLSSARPVGHAGSPGREATEARSKDVIVDMFARSLQGAPPERAVKWTAGDPRKIYGA